MNPPQRDRSSIDVVSTANRSRAEDAAVASSRDVTRPAASIVLHPLQSKMPDELLGYIFELVVPDIQPLYDWDDDSARATAEACQWTQKIQFGLAAVCRRWRHASLTSPRAWSTLCFDVDAVHKDKIHIWESMVACVLSRSGVTTIDLLIYRDEAYADTERNDMDLGPIARCISGAMDRCGYFLLHHDILSTSDFLKPILCQPVPKLRALSFQILTEGLTKELLSEWNIFPNAGALRSIYTSAEYLDELPLSSSVQNCTIEKGLEGDIAPALHRMPNIVSLSLLQLTIDPDEIPEEDPYVCASLRSLVIHFEYADTADGLHRIFVAPELRKLGLFGRKETCGNQINYVRLVAQSAASTLVKLTFPALKTDSVPAFIDVLRSLPQLARLVIVDTLFSKEGLHDLFDAFSRPDKDDKWLCPNMTRFYLESCTAAFDIDIVDVECFAMIRSRPTREFRTLQRFEVRAYEPRPTEPQEDETRDSDANDSEPDGSVGPEDSAGAEDSETIEDSEEPEDADEPEDSDASGDGDESEDASDLDESNDSDSSSDSGEPHWITASPFMRPVACARFDFAWRFVPDFLEHDHDDSDIQSDLVAMGIVVR